MNKLLVGILGIFCLVVIAIDVSASKAPVIMPVAQIMPAQVLSVQQAALPTTPAIGIAQPACNLKEITQKIVQKIGLNPSTMFSEIQEIDNQNFLLIANIYTMNVYQQSQLYFYNIGVDGRFNTPDDQTFLIDAPYMGNTFKGTYTISNPINLFWESTSSSNNGDIKTCTITTNGCINTKIITTIPTNSYSLLGMTYSSTQSRLYMVTLSKTSNQKDIVSCSLQPTAPDACNKGISFFTIHQSNINYLSKSLPEIGFIYSLNNVDFVFNVQTQTNSLISANIKDYDSVKAFAPPVLFLALTNLGTNVLGLTIIDATTGNNVAVLETVPNQGYSYFLGLDKIGLATLYLDKSKLIGKRVGNLSNFLGDFSTANVQLGTLTQDSLVLGILNGSLFIQFTCTP